MSGGGEDLPIDLVIQQARAREAARLRRQRMHGVLIGAGGLTVSIVGLLLISTLGLSLMRREWWVPVLNMLLCVCLIVAAISLLGLMAWSIGRFRSGHPADAQRPSEDGWVA